MVPLVAIVGRPNVGKSRLFNRLMRARRAIVQDDPGVTRDRHYGITLLDDREVQIVDTGGFVPEADSSIDRSVREQVRIAIDEADLVLLVMDARHGLSPQDRDLALLLRRTGKPVIHVANKVDGPKQQPLVGEFYELGVDAVLPTSAEHGLGIDDLVDRMVALLPAADAGALKADPGIRLALIGRPNAGKSSLFNALVGDNRVIVSDEPGTTRDPVDLRIETAAGPFVLVDTAGIRRKRTKSTAMERYAIIRAERSISGADVVCLVIDAAAGPTDQDARLAAMIDEAGRGLVIGLTKFDLVPGREATRALTESVEQQLAFVSHAPALRISAVTGKGLSRLWSTARRVHRNCGERIATAELNRFLAQAVSAHAPPAHHGKSVRLYFITQPQVHPPTFVISTSAPAGIPTSYRRFLVNRIRKSYRFEGAPLRLLIRGHRKPPRRA